MSGIEALIHVELAGRDVTMSSVYMYLIYSEHNIVRSDGRERMGIHAVFGIVEGTTEERCRW